MPAVAVVADDFGMSAFRTDGILECFRAGSVSQASLMVTGDDAVRAVRLARAGGLPLGLHFNITQGLASARWPLVAATLGPVAPPSAELGGATSAPPSAASAAAAAIALEFMTPVACAGQGGAGQQGRFLGKDATFLSVGNVIAPASVFAGSLEPAVSSSATAGCDDDISDADNDDESTANVEESAATTTRGAAAASRAAAAPVAAFDVVLEELAAQLARFEQLTGSFPFALDGHHHVQALPVVARVIARFFRSPTLETLSPRRRAIVAAYLPGAAAAAAVRALRYLRVPLPPAGDVSRAEHWQRCPWQQQQQRVWLPGTVTGPAFFPRIVTCAYDAMLLWERVGLFGPIAALPMPDSDGTAGGSPSPARSQLTSPTSRLFVSGIPAEALLSDAAAAAEQSDTTSPHRHRVVVVDMHTPLRRRGIAASPSEAAAAAAVSASGALPSNGESSAAAAARQAAPSSPRATVPVTDFNRGRLPQLLDRESHPSPAPSHRAAISVSRSSASRAVAAQRGNVGVAQAIVPRRLASFASGANVNADALSESLARFVVEERSLAIRRAMAVQLHRAEALLAASDTAEPVDASGGAERALVAGSALRTSPSPSPARASPAAHAAPLDAAAATELDATLRSLRDLERALLAVTRGGSAAPGAAPGARSIAAASSTPSRSIAGDVTAEAASSAVAAAAANSFQLYEQAIVIGNEWPRAQPCPMAVEPWATPTEAEVMVHPSAPVPAAPSMPPPAQDLVSPGGKRVVTAADLLLQRSDSPPISRHEPAATIPFFGPTADFYCAWSRSPDRQLERDFLVSDAFSGAIARARFALAAYAVSASGRS
jgi:predicted glycoside hydrolase/deacetylase ChbG (UPF0249 family)